MKKIITAIVLATISLYPASDFKIMNEGEDSDSIVVQISGKGEFCEFNFESTGKIYSNSCLELVNENGGRIYCTPQKKICKNYFQIREFLFPPPPSQQVSPEISQITVSKLDWKSIERKALPITQNNINEYIQRINKAANYVSLRDSQIQKAIKVYKEPIEDMGYGFDETILNITKVLMNVNSDSHLAYTTHELWNNIVQMALLDPTASVLENYVSRDTMEKLFIFNKFRYFKESDLLALNHVRACQERNNGVCYASQYAQVLLDSGFITNKDRNTYSDNPVANAQMQQIFALAQKSRQNSVYASKEVKNLWVIRKLLGKVSSNFWKYLTYTDGSAVINSWFLDGMENKNEKSFRVNDQMYRELSQYDPWWN